MKMLNNPDVVLYELSIVHMLPQMALELFGVKDIDRVDHGEILTIHLAKGTLKAEVFKPGERFILKRIEFHTYHSLPKLGRFRRFLNYFFKLNDLNDYSSTRLTCQQVSSYIYHELNLMEQDVIYHAKGLV